MRKKRLSVRLIAIILIMMSVPVVITVGLHRYNRDALEGEVAQRLYRERYATYDDVLDHVEVTYDRYLGLSYVSDGMKLSLARYDAHLRIVRKDGILLYDSRNPTEVRNALNMEYELKLIADRGDLFSTQGKYIRPISEGNEVVAYAIITDDPVQLERGIYAGLEEQTRRPYYYGAAAMLLSALVILIVLYREILRPVRLLRRSTQRITQGDLDFEVDCRCDHELGELCDDFRLMQQSLRTGLQQRLEEKDRYRLFAGSVQEEIADAMARFEKTEETEQLQQALCEVMEDLADVAQGRPIKLRINREIMSSYRLVEELKALRRENRTARTHIHLLEPAENSMLFVDWKKSIKGMDNLVRAMDAYTVGETELFMETVSDRLDYSKLQCKLFWGRPRVIEEVALEDFLHNVYMKETTQTRKGLTDALLLMREILEESEGDLEILYGEQVCGFILRFPRYTPGV